MTYGVKSKSRESVLPPSSPLLQFLALLVTVGLFIWTTGLLTIGIMIFVLKFLQLLLVRIWHICTGKP